MIFTPNFNTLLDQHITTAVVGNDIISRLCYGTVKDLVNMMPYWAKLDETNDQNRATNLIHNELTLTAQNT
jgi:hypothetical protein